MLYLACYGHNTSQYLGLLYIIFGISYLIFMICWLVKRSKTLNNWSLNLYHLQLIFGPIILGGYGLIMIFHGWRLHLPLQFSQFLLLLLITYLIVKDIVINKIYENRRENL